MMSASSIKNNLIIKIFIINMGTCIKAERYDVEEIKYISKSDPHNFQ